MQSVRLMGIVFAGLALSGAPAPLECGARCECIPPGVRGMTFKQGVAESRQLAAVVFRGRVVRADPRPSEGLGALHKGESSPSGTALLTVTKVWKGEVGDTAMMTLKSDTSCDLWLREGEEYVVFATRLQDQSLYTHHCSGTVSAEHADSTLAALGVPVRHSEP